MHNPGRRMRAAFADSWRRLRAAFAQSGRRVRATLSDRRRRLRAAVATALALILVATALAFPITAAGGIASALIVALTGAVVASAWPHISPALARVPRWTGRLLAVAIVLAIGAAIFVPPFAHPIRYTVGDWGPHHANLAALIAGLLRGHIPHWEQAAGTGDSPFDLYPTLPYLIAAGVALITGATHHLAAVLMGLGAAAYVLVAVGTARIASRIAPWPLAALAGLVAIIDRGALSNGGYDDTLHWALLHTAVAEVFALAAIAAVLDALERPRLRTSIAIWILTGLATACHPSSLLLVAAAVVGLLCAAALARDVRPLRSLAAAGHLLIGTVLGSVAWLPLSRRLMRYGLHYGSGQKAPWVMFADLISHPWPAATFAIAVYIGYIGIVAAALSRRALPTFVAATAATLFFGITNWPYLVFGLSPSPAFTRMASTRMLSLVKPFVYAGAAYAVAIVIRYVRAGWHGAGLRSRCAVGAAAALALAGTCRCVAPFYHFRTGHLRAAVTAEAPDPHGFAKLESWAREQAAVEGPAHFGRLLFQGKNHFILHITADTGLPTLHTDVIPDLFLRERIENSSPASLRRFDIRWVVKRGHSPTLGNPATERTFGSYHLRELSGWDGKFARIERGHGTVTVTDLEDERVEVVLKSDAPALVALGTGFYPRWRVRSHGHLLRTYALPAIPGGHTHVVAAWLPPGPSLFTPDGPLPSDGAGDLPALAALLAAVAIIVTWSRPRWRIAALRRIARTARWLARRRRRTIQAAAIALPLLLLAAAVAGRLSPTRALKLGNGLFGGGANVSLRRHGGRWHRCGYSRLRGAYACRGLGQVSDATGKVIKDAARFYWFPAPLIDVRSDGGGVAFRIRTRARLSGSYWLAARSTTGMVAFDGTHRAVRLGRQTRLSFAGGGERAILISGSVRGRDARIALVRISSLEPPRPFLAPPPPAPPPEVARLAQRGRARPR